MRVLLLVLLAGCSAETGLGGAAAAQAPLTPAQRAWVRDCARRSERLSPQRIVNECEGTARELAKRGYFGR